MENQLPGEAVALEHPARTSSGSGAAGATAGRILPRLSLPAWGF